MAQAPLTEWNSVEASTDQRDAAGLGASETFTIRADGTFEDQKSFLTENTGQISVQIGNISLHELNILDRLVDKINQEAIPDHLTQVKHQVPEDTHTLVLHNQDQDVTLYQNLDERSDSPGTYYAYDNRADIAETSALNLFLAHLEHKYVGGDFLV